MTRFCIISLSLHHPGRGGTFALRRGRGRRLRGGLLSEPGPELGERAHVFTGPRDGPNLISIDHDHIALIVTNDLSTYAQPPLLFPDRSPNLESLK